MNNIGIVGHQKSKFNDITETTAKNIIFSLLKKHNILVSGGCHLEGIDIWAEEIATEIGIPKERQIIHIPKILTWSGGYRERNLKIAKDSDIVNCIVVEKYPEEYIGMRFDYCYHCYTSNHIKSGGCWTAKQAKKAVWYIIKPDGSYYTIPDKIETFKYIEEYF